MPMTFGEALAVDAVQFDARLRNDKVRGLLMFFCTSFHLSLELYFYMLDLRLSRRIMAPLVNSVRKMCVLVYNQFIVLA